jgi:translation elongation factor EF-Tu-like GTPase
MFPTTRTATPTSAISSATALQESETDRFLNILSHQLEQIDSEIRTLCERLERVSFATPVEPSMEFQEAGTPFTGRLRGLCQGADELRRKVASIHNGLAI